jgi:signal transduction histidine kinase
MPLFHKPRILESNAAKSISGPFSRIMLGLVLAFTLTGILGMIGLRWTIRHNLQQNAADNYAKFIAYQLGNLAGVLESPDYWEFYMNGIEYTLTPAMRLEGIEGIKVVNDTGEVIVERTAGPKPTGATTIGGYPILFNNNNLGRVYVSLAFPSIHESLGSMGHMMTAHLATLTAKNYGILVTNQLATLNKELPEPDYWEYEANKFMLILSDAMRLDGISRIVILDKTGNIVAEKKRKTATDYEASIQTDIVDNNTIIGKMHVFIDFPGIQQVTKLFQIFFAASLILMGIVLYFLPVRIIKRLENSLLDLNRGLENKIGERTALLTETNKRLQTELIHRRELEDSLVQSEKMSAVGQLAAGVAHEINNPLGIILGFAQSVVKRLKNENDPLTLPLKTIEREAVRCKDLVQNLLVFSRTSKSAQLEEVDLNAAAEVALSLISTRTKTHNVELIKELCADSPKIRSNKSQLQQIIVNLANNAIDAMPKGGTLTIRTSLSGRQPGHVEIQMRDTGSGVPKEMQKKIFEPFFTTKEVGKGTGLGLSLVYEMVTKHYGTIELASEEGKGTEFAVFLPVHSAAKAHAPRAS